MASDSKNRAGIPGNQVEKYEHLIKRLQQERKALQEIIDRDYREARRYVRSHPEQGVSIAFISGIAVGYVLGKLGR
ncbi:hypothetical protein [Fodinibius salsisoli]|uniref:DUF883 domain-containing protein n=1 Tax=Fodinibius salsisoli TaxID=2820877 RepID=A0ABT3PT89_9BACT|nr:hypothetical protein [Fodinibius salsisoli]MCW9709078.1 hypothetical protein [Fodinibius salsisoli]